MAHGRPTLILCDLITPVNDRQAILIRDAGILVKGSRIERVISRPTKSLQKQLAKSGEIIDRRGWMALPGLFDLHFHWVQDSVCLMPKDSLLAWLKNYTWPAEQEFKDLDFAKKHSINFSQKLLSVGTLGGATYGSIHGHTVGLALQKFVGHFIAGNVLMTMNSPRYLSQSEREAQNLTDKLSRRFRQRYAVTPRFAPTVHPATMELVSQMAKRRKSFIQTHLCETREEIEYVLDIYHSMGDLKNIKSYAEIYGRCGILGPRSIVGHGIYLSSIDLAWLLKTKTIVAHCPTSNAPIREQGLGSGKFDLKLADKHGLRWALASDIGGGPYLSMFDVIHSFVRQQKFTGRASYVRGLYRATALPATFLDFGGEVGQIKNRQEANFIFVPSPKYRGAENSEDILRRIIERKLVDRSSFNHLVAETWWQGQSVYSLLGK